MAAKTAMKSKNSPDSRLGKNKKMFNGKEVVLVRMITLDILGRKTSADIVAYKEDSLTGKDSMFVMNGDQYLLWSQIDAFNNPS